ncbi:hypothetical protein JKP88DRAFT_178802 [Tribonema minus]|uniref:SPX domain-containing protein n=1 Tax=Tribonema minus TaxID=303371 RepID=A0A835Z5J1_9STRA|nr:hypothetical protein JKP88DRAFT_178802 [Tribonema minus]
MKFGKNLERVVELSDPEWSPFWLNYKHLKKMLKEVQHTPAPSAAGAPIAKPPNGLSSPEALSKSAGEVAFFKFLRQELRKCKEFFASAESQFLVRRARVREGWRQLTAVPEVPVDGEQYKRLMAACVRLYKDLLLLENFAIMNYTAFSKILKKHDKLTGFCTRERYMKNVVNMTTSFTHYPRVLEMLEDVEELFRGIQTHANIAHSSEEQLFIDAMRRYARSELSCATSCRSLALA